MTVSKQPFEGNLTIYMVSGTRDNPPLELS